MQNITVPNGTKCKIYADIYSGTFMISFDGVPLLSDINTYFIPKCFTREIRPLEKGNHKLTLTAHNYETFKYNSHVLVEFVNGKNQPAAVPCEFRYNYSAETKADSESETLNILAE